MGQISRTTNPTGLKRIDKSAFTVRIHEDPIAGRSFWIEKFDHAAVGLSASIQMACIAHSGNTEEYFKLGSVSSFRKQPNNIRDLATDRPLRFRFVFHEPGKSLLVGYADGIRAANESGYLGNSLVDIEPTDLGGLAWKLELPSSLQDAGAKPVVLVERDLFPTAATAAKSSWFGILVMPEVMRQIAHAISGNPSSLDDPGEWPSAWAPFIADLKVEPLSGDPDEATREAWVSEIMEAFARRGIVTHQMHRAIAEMDGELK